MSSHSTPSRISSLEKIGYGLGDAGSNVVFQMLLMYMAYFYTDVFGLEAAAMGTLLLTVRVVDAVTDPIMGAVCDRTNTRFGKFRPYLLWMSVPFAIVATLCFTTPDLSPQGKLLYAYVTYLLLMIVYTAINVPYCALGGVITADTRQRVSLNSYRFFLATAAGALVAAATLPLVGLLGGGSDERGFQLTMALLATLAVLMFVACFSLTKERVTQISSATGTFWRDVECLLRNDQWLVVATLDFLLMIATVIRRGSAIYYLVWCLGRPDLVAAFLTFGMLGSMLGAAAAPLLTRRVSKVSAYAGIHTVVVALSVAMFLAADGHLVVVFMLFALAQFFTQMGSPILWAMMADTVDYGELTSGRRITGMLFAGSLFFLKLGMAVGGALLGWLLAYFGYQSHAASQPSTATEGIVLLFTLIPAIGHLVLIAAVHRYRLDNRRCDEIRAELNRRQMLATGGHTPQAAQHET